ncbi:hypothetical protein [Dendrosporobacter sp. 1207_IL3150]
MDNYPLFSHIFKLADDLAKASALFQANWKPTTAAIYKRKHK